jgi:two-component system response regulator AauR
MRQLRGQLARPDGIDRRIIGHWQQMVELRERIEGVAPVPADVLILGETGTGKELIARSRHQQSRRSGPLVAIHCAGLPETRFDAEIFGYEVGAFSRTAKQRLGKIEYAHNGTLFLDEIESMPMVMQIKLLRVLQERVIERLGSNRLLPVNVITVDLPPLRERRNQTDRFVLGLKRAPGRDATDKQVWLSEAIEPFKRGMIVEELRRRGDAHRQDHAVRQDQEVRDRRPVLAAPATDGRTPDRRIAGSPDRRIAGGHHAAGILSCVRVSKSLAA